MGRRGPKPQSGAVREQKAAVRSKQARAAVASDQAQPAGAGAPPKWLKGEGLRIWQRLAPSLRTMKLLTDADALAFARYCRNFARWLELQQRLDKGGEFYEIETASGTVRRADPAFAMGDRIERMLLAIEDRFGLNPAERQRIYMARSQAGASAGDLFGPREERRPNDPAAEAAPAAKPEEGPIGLLN